MIEDPEMPRAIDHLVLAVPDLAAATDLYRAVGFTVGSPNRHPWGTVNAVVALDGAYLELIGLAPDYRPPAPGDPASPFADLVAAAVARGGGLAAVALGSGDADADADAFRAAGIGTGRRLDFARDAEGPDGSRRTLRFSLAFADLPGLDEAGLFACRHHQPFGDPAARQHRNGARRLERAVLAAARPSRHVPALTALFGAGPQGPPERPSFATPTGRLDIVRPAEAALDFVGSTPGRFAAFRVTVGSLVDLRAVLERAGVPHAPTGDGLVVPPGAAFGVALAFSDDASAALVPVRGSHPPGRGSGPG